MWAFGVEICISPLASKKFNSILPHTTSKGGGYGFNSSIYFSGWVLGVVLCCSFLKVGVRVSTFKQKYKSIFIEYDNVPL